MFVVLLKYKKPMAELEKYLQAHRDLLQKYYDKGQLVCSGPQIPREGGVVISNAQKREDVARIIEEDPFYLNDICDYTIIEFDPVKFAKGFESFIKKSS